MKENRIHLPGLIRMLFVTVLLQSSLLLSRATNLAPGDILYADPGNALVGGLIVKVDATSGQQSVVASGGFLVEPFDLVLTQDGNLIVSDTTGSLVRVEPQTGQQTLLAANSTGTLGMPCGMGVEKHGEILVANTQGILLLDPVTGQTGSVASNGKLAVPIAVAPALSGELFVLNAGASGQLIRISPGNGSQKVVAQGGFLHSPQAVTLTASTLYVTDMTVVPGTFAVGRVLRIDSRTGAQSVLAQGHYLVEPVGIAADANGDLVVGDPYVVNELNPDVYDGGLVRIDHATGAQTLIVRGSNEHMNPRGVLIVPQPAPNAAKTTAN